VEDAQERAPLENLKRSKENIKKKMEIYIKRHLLTLFLGRALHNMATPQEQRRGSLLTTAYEAHSASPIRCPGA
jgi:hypothetical protein